MAQSLRPWITSTLLSHDDAHGADLTQRCTTPVLCQLVEPDSCVAAIVSDRTHRVAAIFDASATDSYERSAAGESPERLTRSLRSILRLREYTLGLIPPLAPALGAANADSALRFPRLAAAPLPRLQLRIHRWDTVTGDAHDPVFFPHTHEPGLGSSTDDQAAALVLRKWWLGEFGSQQASKWLLPATTRNTRHMTRSGPKSRQSTSAAAPAEASAINASALQSVYKFVTDCANAGKALPVWLFSQPSPAQRAALDHIDVFGVDVYTDPTTGKEGVKDHPVPAEEASQRSNGHTDESLRSNGHSDESQLSNGHSHSRSAQPPSGEHDSTVQEAQLPSPVPAPEASADEDVSASQLEPAPVPECAVPEESVAEVPEPAEASGQRFVTPDDSSDAESEIPVRPVRGPTQVRYASPNVPSSSQPTGETDDEDLSDYERERRRAVRHGAKAANTAETAAEAAAAVLGEERQGPEHGDAGAVAGESLSQSQDSTAFNLSQYAGAASAPAAPVVAPQYAHDMTVVPASSSAPAAPDSPHRVLVPTTTTEESAAAGDNATDESLQGPQEHAADPALAPAPELESPVAPERRKRPRESGGTTASADADDEASQRPAKRARSDGTSEAKGSVGEAVEDAPAHEVPAATPPAPSPVKLEPSSPHDSSWIPPPGQRSPPTSSAPSSPVSVRRPRESSAPRAPSRKYILVQDAVDLVLPGYKPDLLDFDTPGLDPASVEEMRDRAIEARAARERSARRSSRRAE